MNKRIAKSIRDVATLEKNIANKMQDFVLEYDHKKSNMMVSDNDNIKTPFSYQKISFADLKGHFNNKGFGEFGKSRISFAKSGQYFSTHNFPEKFLWIVEDMIFQVPNIHDLSLDNISCNGQFITVEAARYGYVMFLGCAEQNSFSDEIEIGYSDGDSEKLIISLSDWYLPPQFNDHIAWQGNIVEKVDGSYVLSAHLYHVFASKYKMNKDRREVVSVKLPWCRNMHLFSITLGI
jgi:hypothetical protein